MTRSGLFILPRSKDAKTSHGDNRVKSSDWKNTAGCGRFFISLHGIYPQEAIPTSHLLQVLEKISGTAWSYFYVQ